MSLRAGRSTHPVPRARSAPPPPGGEQVRLLLCNGFPERFVTVGPGNVVDLEVEARRLVEEFVRTIPVPTLTVHVNPPSAGLAGLESWFWATGYDGGPITHHLEVFDVAVDVQVVPTGVRWQFGDGATLDGDLGRPYRPVDGHPRLHRPRQLRRRGLPDPPSLLPGGGHRVAVPRRHPGLRPGHLPRGGGPGDHHHRLTAHAGRPTPWRVERAMLHARRLNHAVLWVRDVDVSADFYTRVMGFSVVDQMPGQAAFSYGRPGPTTTTTSGCSPWVRTLPSPSRRCGLYHLAWEVETIDELAKARQVLSDAEALVGQSDHGATKSCTPRTPTATSSR